MLAGRTEARSHLRLPKKTLGACLPLDVVRSLKGTQPTLFEVYNVAIIWMVGWTWKIPPALKFLHTGGFDDKKCVHATRN